MALASYIPQLKDVVPLLVTWGVAGVLLAAGTAVTRRGTAAEFRIGAGWGALCLAMTLWGVFLPVSLRVPAILFVLAAAAAQLVPGRRVPAADWQALLRMLVITLPLWLVMAPIQPSQPDTFLYLLPNAYYLVDHGHLPAAWLPPSFSQLPAAPYNAQFLSFLGSLADPDYPSAGTSLVNVMLDLAAGLAVARGLAAAAPGGAAPLPCWGLTALGFLLVTLLNLGFVPRVAFSAHGETPLMVTALLSAWLFVAAQGQFAAGRRPGQTLALSLILAAMINTKQSGIGLVAALAGAAVVTGSAERAVAKGALLRATALALLPALFLYALWRYYAAHAGVAELEPLPLARWNWAGIPATLASIAKTVAEKPAYFGGVGVALLGLPVLLRRRAWTPATRLLLFHAAAFGFYNCFLMLTYIAHFPGEMSAEAHSFFRYNTHLALILMLSLALFARDIAGAGWPARRLWRPAAAALVALALVAPLAFVKRLRFDLVMPQPLVRELGERVKPYLNDGDRLALLLPGDNDSVAAMLAGVLMDTPPRRRGLDLLVQDAAGPATLAEAARRGYRIAVISCTQEELFGVAPGAAALLEHDGGEWRRLAAWPYPAAARQRRWQRILAWPPLCRPW